MTITGTGIGLRGPHLAGLLEGSPVVPWLELLADNYLGLPDDQLEPLEILRRDHGMALHAVGISIAGVDPLDKHYLNSLRRLAERLSIETISDHLCWTQLSGHFFHDLLPFPRTLEALDHVAGRIECVQEILRRPLVLENVSAYVQFQSSKMEEAELLAELVKRTGCKLLLDLNNLYVNQENLGETTAAALSQLPLDQVAYLHLAGHRREAGVLVDTHDQPICEQVWQLFREVLRSRPDVPALIEWDHQLPDLDVLLQEQLRAEQIRSEEVEALAA